MKKQLKYKLNIIIICLFFFTTIILFTTIIVKHNKYQVILPSDKKEINIIVISDLHFLPKILVEEGSLNSKPNYYGDGRVVIYSEEIIDAFIYEMNKIKPEAIIITGDLTFNGARENHEILVGKLNILVKNGIRVLVTPGNHDINSNIAAHYYAKKAQPIPSINGKEFKNLYYNLGFGNAISNDLESLSYIYQISKKLWVVMLDSVIYQDSDSSKTLINGEIKDSTLNWLDRNLQNAKNAGINVITASHHNLYQHNELFTSGYQLNNTYELQEILNRYQVKLHLSGHMHIQHIIEDDINEILTSSLSIYGHHYGLIKINDYMIDYQAKSIDMKTYAIDSNMENPDLLDFNKYSFAFFTKSSYIKTFDQFMFDDSSRIDIANAFAEAQSILNPYYFNGNVIQVLDKVKNANGYSIWNSYINLRSYVYLQSMINSGNTDHQRLRIYY